MRKIKLTIKLNVPDDFTVGCCEKCPLKQEDYYDDYYISRITVSCKLGYHPAICPLDQDQKEEIDAASD